MIKINSDIYAWIYVPGTRIDYPVAQSQESDDHYLKYNFKNEPEFAGCIYTEKANKKDFSDPNTIFYGHNMRNGSMFQNLHKFEDEAFLRNTKKYMFTHQRKHTHTRSLRHISLTTGIYLRHLILRIRRSLRII